MKKLTALLLLFSNAVHAQLPTQQKLTPFDKFISRPEIEWAAYINDTTRFENINLNKILLLRLAKNEIKASLPVGSGTSQAGQIKFSTKKEIDAIKFRSDEVAIFDSLGNMIRTEHRSPGIDTSSFTLTDVTEILYIENGQLKTYVPWVATMLPVVTSTGVYLGEGDYFSTCFNYNYKYRSPKKNRITWLAKTKRKINLDSFEVRNKLKELYGRNPVQTLWPYILQNKITILDYEKNSRLNPEKLTTDLINEDKIAVPVYDSTGRVVGRQEKSYELNPQSFTSMELVQDWYYDQTGNIVFTSIREIYLYAKKWLANEEVSEPRPILKIVFQ